MFGDAVDLYTGTLSFSTTDVSLPGNSSLPVAVTRTFSQGNSGYDFSTGLSWGGDNAFADWQIDVPNISGLFQGWHDNRCDVAVPPNVLATGTGFSYVAGELYWTGNTVSMPGGGGMLAIDANTPKPSTGGPYKWITPGRVVFSCLPTIQNGSGQGFLAVAPNGTKYWFNYMATYGADSYVYSYLTAPYTTKTAIVHRSRNVLYATRVEDRFGNWVTYSFGNGAVQARLNSIQSNDGRQITLAYNTKDQVTSVSDGTHVWRYQYAGNTLTGVTQPDNGQWAINLSAISNAQVKYADSPPGEPTGHTCFHPGQLDPDYTSPEVGTITHPSGAVGTFTIDVVRHGRSNVPALCSGYTPAPYVNDPTDDFAILPFLWHAFALTSKTISGPSLPAQTWAFSYGRNSSWFYPDGQSEPICKTETCLNPICLSGSCAGTATTTVIGPSSTDWKRYQFGNSYRYNEGKLLRILEGTDSANVLRSTEKTYELAQSGTPYATKIGTSQQPRGDGFTGEYPRPEVASVVSLQGVNFSRMVDKGCTTSTAYCFDNFLRQTRLLRASTGGAAGDLVRTETTAYSDDLGKWVIGQTKSVTDVATGKVMTQTDYDATLDLPIRTYRFGILQNTLAYNTDGTLASVKDGLNNTIALSSWYRGVPRTINFPTTVSESAVVNADGSIASTTDELGYVNAYGYDAMGRLNKVTYPTGDTNYGGAAVAWNASNRTFVAVATAEYGIPAGHWKLTEQTGNGQATTYYDAQWRPVLVLTEDMALATSKSFVVNRYDLSGQLVFTSYPVGSLTSVSDTLSGTTRVYDALGRVTQVQQNSELAAPLNILTTTTEYLLGFQTRVTNPRGYKSITSYQVFDTPSADAPVSVITAVGQPEQQTTTIVRDGFGKPLSVTRSGAQP